MSKYDNVFKTIPGLQKGMFEGYLKTVKLDEATKIITDTPVTVADYYEPVLQIVSEYLNQNGGAAQPAAPAAPAAPATPQPTPEVAAKAKAEEDAKRRRARADRGDIFTPGGNEQPGDDDDNEWDTAMKNVFGPNQ